MRLEQSVRELEKSPSQLELAVSLVELGAARRRGGKRSSAREPLRRGMDLAFRLGAAPVVDRATVELKATGARPRRAVLRGADALTASERRVAELAAAGRTNREIAQTLFVTLPTVETHMRHVFQKLDIRARQEIRSALDG